MSSLLDKKQTGIVFSVQKYSIHDGPGIRTNVFLKGCPLRCEWCSNPESQAFIPEVAYNRNKCLGTDKCTRCLDVCETACTLGAVSPGKDGKVDFHHDVAGKDVRMAKFCPANAMIVYGEEQSVDEVLKRVEEDERFYARSGGGLTLSGGEPFSQGDFALALLREARHRHINTAVETCGVAPWSTFEKCLPYVNTLIFDVKSMDAEKNKAHTGHSIEVALDNLQKIKTHFPDLPVHIRTPVIPGYNDSEEAIQAVIDFLNELPGSRCEYEVLPYHRMGQPKYENLGREYPLVGAKLDDDVFARCKALADAYNANMPVVEMAKA